MSSSACSSAALALRRDRVDHAATVGFVGPSSDVPLRDEAVDEAGHALLRDGEFEREIRLDGVTRPDVEKQAVLGRRHAGLGQREFRQTGQPHDRVADRRVFPRCVVVPVHLDVHLGCGHDMRA